MNYLIIKLSLSIVFRIVYSQQINNEESPAIRSSPLKYVDVSNLHNEHQASPLYMPEVPMNLPECAAQQVCSALFVRLNHTCMEKNEVLFLIFHLFGILEQFFFLKHHTRKLCECGRDFNWQCNTLSKPNDGHTIELTKKLEKKIYTQIKICEPLSTIRTCRRPTDWTLLALQSERTGKAHYVAVCRCPKAAKLEGPFTHNKPPYARIAGIRVYGMLCTQMNREFRKEDDLQATPDFPWDNVFNVLNSTHFNPINF